MKALSVRQPWAWLIVRPDLVGPARNLALAAGVLKDIENRSWPTRFRGRLFIHAAKGMTRAEYEGAQASLSRQGGLPIELPPMTQMQRGGIVGAATLIDCVRPAAATSRWHIPGAFGFQLAEVEAMAFRPLKGQLGFFEVPA